MFYALDAAERRDRSLTACELDNEVCAAGFIALGENAPSVAACVPYLSYARAFLFSALFRK